jgi:hypothetical protein
MKKFLLGAAAALAIAAPGVASAQSAYVDATYATTDGDIAGVDFDGEGWGVGGAAAWSNFQVDGTYSSADDTDTYSIGGHLFGRNDSHLFGGFVNLGNVDTDGGSDYDFWTVGLEGQYYMARTTLDGSLSYSEGDDIDSSLTSLDVGLTQFVTDNFSFGGGLGFGNIDTGVGDADVLSYGLNTEYQFASMPISVFGGWNHLDIDDIDAEADTLSVGVRYNWGGSLFERNRSGASLSRSAGLGRFGGVL